MRGNFMILGVLAENLVPLLFEPTILRLCLDENKILEGAKCLDWHLQKKAQIAILCTLPETNIAPESNPLEKEIPIGHHHF